MYLQKWKGCFLKTLHRIWEFLVSLQLLSDCWVVFWINESRKQITTTFCTNLSKKAKRFHVWECDAKLTRKGLNLLNWKCQVTMTKKGLNLLTWKFHVALTVKKCIIATVSSSKSILKFHCQKLFTSFSYQRAISFNHGVEHYCFNG